MSVELTDENLGGIVYSVRAAMRTRQPAAAATNGDAAASGGMPRK
jgi:hypothetical protein